MVPLIVLLAVINILVLKQLCLVKQILSEYSAKIKSSYRLSLRIYTAQD